MAHPDEKLASLIGSRICHDLISPIGAVTNGLELLELSGVPKGPEVDLVNQSAQNAAARIKYYRLAFGDCGRIDSHHVVRTSEVISILADVFVSGRVSVHWDVSEDRSRTEVKAALLAVMCAETALGIGGQITVSMQENDWIINAQGSKLMLHSTPWDALEDDIIDGHEADTAIAPAAVQFALLPQVLRELGRKLSKTATENSLTLRF